MKVKYISELSEQEKNDYYSSELYTKVTAKYDYLEIYLEYSKEYFPDSYQDKTLLIFDKNDFYIATYAFCDKPIYSFYGQPIEIVTNIKNPKIAALAYNDLLIKLKELNFEQLICFNDNHLTSLCYENINPSPHAYIDLNQSDDDIKMNVRKSYKSLINWGSKSLNIKVYDKQNADKTIFDSFRDFHIKVAKRQTRSDESWDLQYQALTQGYGFIVMGYLTKEIDPTEKLVSAVLICHSNQEAYYGVAVNDRELMAQNMPLGHAVLMEAIYKAKQLGLQRFVLGDVTNCEDEKINAITKYKKGFTNTIECKIKQTIQL